MTNSNRVFSPEKILENIMGLLDEEIISREVGEPIDLALETFRFDVKVPFSHADFNRIIAGFVQHLYREGLRLPRDLSDLGSLTEAVSLLRTYYRGVYTRGYDGALLDAVTGNLEGVEMVLSALAEAIKAAERDKYIASVFVRNIDQLDWEGQCQIVSTYFKQYESSLPHHLRRTDCARWAGHLADLIVNHMSSERLVGQIIGIDG